MGALSQPGGAVERSGKSMGRFLSLVAGDGAIECFEIRRDPLSGKQEAEQQISDREKDLFRSGI